VNGNRFRREEDVDYLQRVGAMLAKKLLNDRGRAATDFEHAVDDVRPGSSVET